MIVHDNYDESIVEGELSLFHALWNTTNDNMFIVKRYKDGDFINEKTNASLKKVFHLENEGIDGVSLKIILDEKSYNSVSNIYKNCLEENKPLTYEESHIIDDEERFWNTTIIPIIDNENDFIRIFGISKEITQLKRLNESLEQEVKKRTKDLENALVQIKQISITDKLTGLYNRHYIDSVLDNMQKMLNRYDTNYALILLDIDDFKDVNDTYGHNIGDMVLKDFSTLLKNSIRETDILGRWGGEEFLLIVPNATKDSIFILANNLKDKIQEYDFKDVSKLTASFGVSILQKDDEVSSFFTRVDKSLYQAKKNGKNRVEFVS